MPKDTSAYLAADAEICLLVKDSPGVLDEALHLWTIGTAHDRARCVFV